MMIAYPSYLRKRSRCHPAQLRPAPTDPAPIRAQRLFPAPTHPQRPSPAIYLPAFFLTALFLPFNTLFAQSPQNLKHGAPDIHAGIHTETGPDIQLTPDPEHHKVLITAGGRPFTEFIYPDSLEKPVLYPIYAPDGQLITRGFPLVPRPGEPVDHPHHLGLWFNYENVNGLDFWNNSFAIPADKKHNYGWIRTNPNLRTGVIKMRDGAGGGFLEYDALWTDQQQTPLLKESTHFDFSATATERIIDRITTLTAVRDISFPDAKDGMLGLRVARELQIPSNAPGQFVDDKGNVTKVAAGNTPDINGNYLTGAGKQGDSAWGTRSDWCMLYGKKQQDTLSIVMIDHPGNPGYPTYWHARGYGLFAANPLGQKIFSNGRESLNFHLAAGKSVTFRYRIVVAAGDRRLSAERIRQLADAFSRL